MLSLRTEVPVGVLHLHRRQPAQRDALYTGSTDNLIKRINEHRDGRFGGFTDKYGVALLVWYEIHETRHAAFVRERQIKEWKRVWKLELIEKSNPGWIDLMDTFGLPE